MLRADAVNHVSILVNDLERARRFYVEMLGMRDMPAEPGGGNPAFSVASRLGVPETPLCRLACGDVEVTLFQRPKPVEQDLIQANGAFHHSFRMKWDDLSRLASNISALRRAGYDIPCEPIYRPREQGQVSMSLYVRDPEGNLLELVGRTPGLPWRTPPEV